MSTRIKLSVFIMLMIVTFVVVVASRLAFLKERDYNITSYIKRQEQQILPADCLPTRSIYLYTYTDLTITHLAVCEEDGAMEFTWHLNEYLAL